VLADLAIESEAATTLGLRLASAVDEGDTSFGRLAVALGKYWVCKRTAPVVAEALECLGGNGYIEENGLARLYREAPVNSIWEGSGNVMCLDVLRAMVKSPESVEIFFEEIGEAASDRRVGDALARLKEELSDFEDAEIRARQIVERMALTLQGALLVRHGHPAVADAFCASRLEGDWGHAFGTLPAGVDTAAIIERHLPVPA
jgi:putative acyl-CoA dehydrogenase